MRSARHFSQGGKSGKGMERGWGGWGGIAQLEYFAYFFHQVSFRLFVSTERQRGREQSKAEV